MLVVALALTAMALLCASASAAKIDVVADTYHIVDGDTIDAFPVGRIRLADIDTPESGQPGYAAAKDAVIQYTDGRRVFLDVDAVDVDDRYNRLVAVVWVRHNATHLINVNRALVDRGLANVSDFPNEFDPSTWALYLRVSGAELPTNWQDANDAYKAALHDLSDAQAALDEAQGDLSGAEAARDAALAELGRVSALLNGSHPASDEALAELEQTRAELNGTGAALAAAESELATTTQQLDETRAELSATQAQQEVDTAALRSQVDAADKSTSLVSVLAVGAAASLGGAGFVLGRRRAPPA